MHYKEQKGIILEFFLKHQQVLLRSIGAFLLLIGFVIHFWVVPQQGMSKNDLAAQRVARMEASVHGASNSSAKPVKADGSHLSEALKSTQAKQMEYLTIIVMLLGGASLGYSFIKKKH